MTGSDFRVRVEIPGGHFYAALPLVVEQEGSKVFVACDYSYDMPNGVSGERAVELLKRSSKVVRLGLPHGAVLLGYVRVTGEYPDITLWYVPELESSTPWPGPIGPARRLWPD